MSKLILHSAFLFLIIAMASSTPVSDQAGEKSFASSLQTFSNDLYSTIISDSKTADKNVIISPLSIEVAVGLAAMGAAGRTAEEMSRGLRLPSTDVRGYSNNFGDLIASFDEDKTIQIANKVYLMEGETIKAQFKEIATKTFRSEAENVDFAKNVEAAKKINDWVESKTNNKIKDLIGKDDLDELTRMVLVNAIHFKGLWEKKFNPSRTSKKPFWVSETESKQVDMMSIKANFEYGEFAQLDAKAIILPYANSSISMFIILPNKKTGLADLQTKVRSLDIGNMRSEMNKVEVDVQIPKFKAEFEIELKDTLSKMGMERMFSPEADFSELLEKPQQLSVSKVIHKAFIEVNEEGTEAAAATGVIVGFASAPWPVTSEFIADKPFIYYLVSNSRQLFSGHVKRFE